MILCYNFINKGQVLETLRKLIELGTLAEQTEVIRMYVEADFNDGDYLTEISDVNIDFIKKNIAVLKEANRGKSNNLENEDISSALSNYLPSMEDFDDGPHTVESVTFEFIEKSYSFKL